MEDHWPEKFVKFIGGSSFSWDHGEFLPQYGVSHSRRQHTLWLSVAKLFFLLTKFLLLLVAYIFNPNW